MAVKQSLTTSVIFGDVWRSAQGPFDTPAKKAESVAKRSTVNPEPTGPFGKTQCFAVERKKRLPSRIATLFLFRSPSAIARLVIAIGVYAINGMTRTRPRPHIRKKLREAVPSFADRNASAAVELERRAGWRSAPIPHRGPSSVLSRMFSAAHRRIVMEGGF